MISTVLFWILWTIWVIGLFFPLTGYAQRAHGAIACILIGILGFKMLGNPLDK